MEYTDLHKVMLLWTGQEEISKGLKKIQPGKFYRDTKLDKLQLVREAEKTSIFIGTWHIKEYQFFKSVKIAKDFDVLILT